MSAKELPAEWANAALSEQILSELKVIKEVLLRTYLYPRGTTFTSILNLPAGGPVTRIDFLSQTGHRNIPMGRFETGGKAVIPIFQVPVSTVIIYNTGPGGVFFDTNRNFNDTTADTPVYANSDYQISADIPSIVSINLVAEETHPAKVRMTAIV